MIWLQDVRLFTPEEELQLKTLFGLNDEDLKLVLDGICYIFEQVCRIFTLFCFHYLISFQVGISRNRARAVIRSASSSWIRQSTRKGTNVFKKIYMLLDILNPLYTNRLLVDCGQMSARNLSAN